MRFTVLVIAPRFSASPLTKKFTCFVTPEAVTIM